MYSSLKTQRKRSILDNFARLFNDDKPSYHYMGTSVIPEYGVVKEVRLAKVNPEALLEKVCMLGCDITTVRNTGDV